MIAREGLDRRLDNLAMLHCAMPSPRRWRASQVLNAHKVGNPRLKTGDWRGSEAREAAQGAELFRCSTRARGQVRAGSASPAANLASRYRHRSLEMSIAPVT
jgi:hypothetical protein